MTTRTATMGEPSAARRTTDAHRIVVGVDGSSASIAALRWAAEEAGRSHAVLEAVYVYAPVTEVAYGFGSYPAVPVDPQLAKESAAVALESALHRALGRGADDVLRSTVAEGSPSHALLRCATGAAMLVVGAHRHHGLGLLLGSTAGSCVRHAIGPVVVVPADDTP